jgi:hypothetical protein
MSVMVGFLVLCGGQCIGADDGCAEQRESAARNISQYVADKVVRHDSAVCAPKHAHGKDIGVRRMKSSSRQPPAQLADAAKGFAVLRAVALVQDRIAMGLHPSL